MMAGPVKRGMFHSYTLAEAEETARMWAGVSLLAFGAVVMVLGKLVQAEGWSMEDAASGGVLAGGGAVLVFAGVWIEMRAAGKCVRLRKAYKKEHPELFDSAGDEKGPES